MPQGVSTFLTGATEYDEQIIKFSGETFYRVDYCGEYASYYLNANGGWDAFLWEGTCKRKSNLTSFEYAKDYDNRTLQFGRMKVNTEIADTYELKTGWLTDEEAERFVLHLVPTTMMYLHNLVDDVILPVTVTDNSVEWKTYRNQGKQLIQYTLNVKSSQDFIRR